MPLAIIETAKVSWIFLKKQSAKRKSFKYRPKNKQPASLHKIPQLHKKNKPNSKENRKFGNTDLSLG